MDLVPRKAEEEKLKSMEGVEEDTSREPFFGTILLLLMILFVVASLAAVGYAAYSSWHVSKEISNKPSITALSLERDNQAPAEGTTEPSVANQEDVAIQEKAAVLKKAQATVMIVLNGGFTKGAAGAAAGVLKQAGYTAVTVGNAIGNYSGVVVYYAAALEKEAGAVKESLLGKYPTVTVSPAITSNKETTTAPIMVIIGK